MFPTWQPISEWHVSEMFKFKIILIPVCLFHDLQGESNQRSSQMARLSSRRVMRTNWSKLWEEISRCWRAKTLSSGARRRVYLSQPSLGTSMGSLWYRVILWRLILSQGASRLSRSPRRSMDRTGVLPPTPLDRTLWSHSRLLSVSHNRRHTQINHDNLFMIIIIIIVKHRAI